MGTVTKANVFLVIKISKGLGLYPWKKIPYPWKELQI